MDAVERGINSRSSRVRAAATKVLDTDQALSASRREQAKANDAIAASLARVEKAEKDRADRLAGAEAHARKLADVEQRLLQQRVEAAGVNNRVINAESQLGAMRRTHATTADAILKTEKALRAERQAEAHDVDRSRRLYNLLQRQREAYRTETNAMRHATLDLAQAKDAESRALSGVNYLQQSMNTLRREGTQQARDMAAAERELTRATQERARAEEAARRQASRVESAGRRVNNARHSFLESEEDRPRRRGGGGGGGGLGGFERGLGGIFTSIPFVPGGKAGAVIGTGLVTALGGIAEAVTTASQALWLLPAATAAAGAGFATLKIGLSGFDKALKDMGDPKKFAKDLQGLAPNAQQAALEIQHLSASMGGLKNLVQQSLFSGVAQQLHRLGGAFMPSIRQMFTGIAGAFNHMFGSAMDQLASGGSVKSIGEIINNIVRGFQNLAPAMAPVVDAFTRIAKVGSDFLPGMGTSIANLAQRFDNFIARAQQTGQLQHWITQGISAAKELGHWIGDLAHKFYDVFGNKNPQQFKQTLDSITGTLTAIGRGMVILANAVNTLVRDLSPVAQMVGGWPNLIRDVVAAWALWKVEKTLGLLGSVAKALSVDLPAAAAEGAGGISAALAGIKMPAWLAALSGVPGAIGAAGAANAATSTDNLDAILKGLPFGVGPLASGGYDLWKKFHHQGLGDDKTVPGKAVPGPGIQRPGADGNAPPGAYGPFKNGYGLATPGFDWSPYDVPGVPEKGKHGIGADRDYTPYGPGYAAPPRPGESEEEYSAEGAVMDARHRLEQDRATLLKMQQDNTITAEERQEQENKIAHDQRELNTEQLRLAEVQQNAVKKNLKGLKDANDEFNNIDEDFGLSKGLPGLVKNLVGMLGDLAAAPLMGQLKAITKATGTDKNTFGAFGMMGQQNIAEGKSPLFGIPAGQPGGPGVVPGNVPWGTVGAGPWDKGYGGVSTTPSVGLAPGLGPASIAPGVATAGYTVGGTGAQLASAIRPAGAAGGPGAQGSSGLNWDALAAKESSGNWGINTGNGYFGGLQFDQSTWNAYKPPGAPSNPAAATKEQQIQAGETAVKARGGPQSLWPQNYGQLYSTPKKPWSAQYDSYQPMGAWYSGSGDSSGGGGGGGFAPAGYSGGGGSVFPGLSGLGTNLPDVRGAHPQEAYAFQAIKQLFPWAQLTAGNWDHPKDNGWHGRGQAIDIGGGTAEQRGQLSNWLTQFSPFIEELINQSPGVTQNIKSGRLGPAIDMPGSVYNTGQAGYHGDHVHLAITDKEAQDFINALSGGGQPAWGPGSTMDTGAGGDVLSGPSLGAPGGASPNFNVVGAPGSPGNPRKAQLTGFGQPDPGAPGGTDPSAPPTPAGPPKGGGWQPQGGGANGIGGLPMAAAMAAASAFPGGGAAAQTAMQLINRTIGYGQQAAAIGMQGLLDTFKVSSPDGEDHGTSDLSQGWYGRVLAGFAGARPALPGGAGTAPGGKKDSNPTDDPSGGKGLGQAGGDTVHNGYGGINISGTGNTVQLGGGQQGPSMSQASDSLSTQASSPSTVGVGGFSL